ncbi:MAG: DUF3187 family protein [Deltaproteobacteria bacterium]|nr:DUF3187 family protein [Deltaproteobacteria bacterium]
MPLRRLSLVLLLCGPCPTSAGVLPAANLAPQHLLHLSPGADVPEVLTVGATSLALDTAYASVITDQRRGDDEARLDMEVARIGLRWARGLGHRLEAGVEVPWLWLGGGRFDHAITGYHRALGFPNSDRDSVGANEFGYRISVDGRRYAPAGGAGFGDAVVGLKWVPPADASAWGLRGFLKLPTGDPDRGLGSGRADGSAGILGRVEGSTLRLCGTLDALFLGGTPNPALRLGTHWAAAATAAAGAEVGWSTEAVVQLSYVASPYATGLDEVDRDVLLLAVGARGPESGRITWAAGFTEDLVTHSSPDFGLFLSLEGRFGGTP